MDVAGEIGFLRYVPKDRHLIFPVSRAGSEATVDVDLDARTAIVKRRSMNLWESLSYLHKIPGPHNVAIRGNWIGTQVWRVLADATIYLLLFISLTGVYLWWAIKAERRIGLTLLRQAPSLSSASSSPSSMETRALEVWNRKLHYYLGLYFLFFLWLFSLTGLMLNHQQWFRDLYERDQASYDVADRRAGGRHTACAHARCDAPAESAGRN